MNCSEAIYEYIKNIETLQKIIYNYRQIKWKRCNNLGKLRYYYGCMNSMKSSTLLMKSYQFEQSGCRVLLFKPSFD